ASKVLSYIQRIHEDQNVPSDRNHIRDDCHLAFQGCAQDTPPESGPITGGHSNSAPSPGTTETSSIFRACSTVKSRSRRRSSARRASSKVSRSPTVSPSTRIAYFDRRSGMIRIRIVAFIPELLH